MKMEYEISVNIDNYIFNRFVKDKVRKEFKLLNHTSLNFLM
jgi:hypothetical protein